MLKPDAPVLPFFWLHVKKSAGQSTRQLLQPHYRLVDKRECVANFPETDPLAWNDVINNYRVPLGEFRFRRCLYARDFVWGQDRWSQFPSFAFSREPVSRFISAFFYLRHHLRSRGALRRIFRRGVSADFDRFIGLVQETRAAAPNIGPVNLHFATHTAAMWPDITDDNGLILLNHVFDLKDLTTATTEIYRQCGFDTATLRDEVRTNVTRRPAEFTPNRSQLARVEALCEADLALHHERLVRL